MTLSGQRSFMCPVPIVRLLHVYLRSGNIKQIAEDLLSNDSMMSAGIHVSNSDVVEEFVYEDTEQLVDLISHVKEMAESSVNLSVYYLIVMHT